MDRAGELLRDNIKATPHLPVLVVAYEFPEFLLNHQGPIVYFGSESPRPSLSCQQLIYRRAHTTGEILQAFEILKQYKPAPRFDLVFIDHNHALEALVEQINGSTDFTHPDTVYVFDDAVPRDFTMTGPVPTQDWWLGEVWMLSQLLQNLSSARESWSVAVEPTGLLIAVGVGKLPAVEVDAQYASLQRVSSLEELLLYVPLLVDEQAGFFRLRAALRACVDPYTKLISVASGSEGADDTMQLDGSESWVRPALDFVLDLSEGDADVSSLYERQVQLPGKRLDTYSDVLLTGFDSFVAQDTFYCKKIDSATEEATRLVRESSYSRTILQMSDEELVLPHDAGADATRINEHVFFGTPDEPDNWGMWILYGVPSACQFLKERGSYDFFFTCLHWPWQRRLLQHMGLAPGDVLEHRLELTYSCSRLSIIRYQFRNLAVNHTERLIFRTIAERFEHRRPHDYGERIYVARSLPGNSHNARQLMNESELAQKLRQLGFAVIQPETLEFPEQVRAFSGARIIIGLGGAGMFNAVFAKPGTQLVTIESSMNWVASHVNLFASCGLNCGVIIGRQDLTDPEPVHKRWQLDVNAAIRQIDAYLS